ncbi:MAG: prephenate dehydrogenase [bacterium]
MTNQTVSIGIYGVGLIGGSLGKALKAYNKSVGYKKYRVFGIGRNINRLKKAKKLGAVDYYTTDPFEVISRLDVLVLAMRVDLIPKFAERLVDGLGPGAVITDVGSVKKIITEKIVKLLSKKKKGNYFVPGHPIAGSEKTGVQNADKDLFRNAYCVLIKRKDIPKDKFNIIKEMWKNTGANVINMDPKDHDTSLALTSHLPHLLAMGLLLLVRDEKERNKQVKILSAGSFRDLTRISDSDPDSWDSIFSLNKSELIKIISLYTSYLNKVKGFLSKGKSVKSLFEQAKSFREKCFSLRD